MSVTPGTRFGTYEIVEAIGKGGMGEVYRARDTKLGRDVAIKVLPEALAKDPERLARFEREARLLASLNHPAIATLYGFEHGVLVMELVEGQTLDALVPMSLDDALPLFEQIAEGLEAAHDKGVVHRDLKPANVKVTPEGKVKILDFGLAKAFAVEEDVSAETSQSPTLTKGTALGTILGTASYMSPEQARGKRVDRRTDVWAFGCCLYEALTGEKAFDGETVTDVLAAVVHREPRLDGLHPKVQRLLKRCLQKDPGRRFRDAGDLLLDLDTAGVPRRRSLRACAIAGVVGMVAGAMLSLLRSPEAPPATIRRTVIPIPASTPIGPNAFAVSPDGARLVYIASTGNVPQVFVRNLDKLEPEAIPGSEGAESVFFSPDGKQIAFLIGDVLKRVGLGGTAPLEIGRASTSILWAGASWAADDTIFFSHAVGLSRIPAKGGDAEILTSVDVPAGERFHTSPELLPDGDTLLFTIVMTDGSTRVALQSLETGERRILPGELAGARYVPTGHLIAADGNGNVLAFTFDLSSLELRGPSSSLGAELSARRLGASNLGFLDFSLDGTLFYQPAMARFTRLTVVTPQAEVKVLEVGDWVRSPRVSPDGTKVVFELGFSGGRDLWVLDLTGRNNPTRFTFGGDNRNPVWAPDGTSIIFNQLEAGVTHFARLPADGSRSDPETLRSFERSLEQSVALINDLSPNGETLLYYTGPSAGSDIWAWSLSADEDPRPLLSSRFSEQYPRVSPDGRWLAYSSDRSGRPEIWVRPYPDVESGPPVQISESGGFQPVWSRDGRSIVYLDGNTFLEVPMRDGRRIGPAARRYTAQFADNNPQFDVGPDGSLYFTQRPESDEGNYIVVVEGWFEELERLASPSP